ncbi:MAG: hypothetical protein H6556_28380 [Lewinellaceae bacterium]|nr:hypothetical protein [Lewinellaceae bacterium]
MSDNRLIKLFAIFYKSQIVLGELFEQKDGKIKKLLFFSLYGITVMHIVDSSYLYRGDEFDLPEIIIFLVFAGAIYGIIHNYLIGFLFPLVGKWFLNLEGKRSIKDFRNYLQLLAIVRRVDFWIFVLILGTWSTLGKSVYMSNSDYSLLQEFFLLVIKGAIIGLKTWGFILLLKGLVKINDYSISKAFIHILLMAPVFIIDFYIFNAILP